MLRRLSIEFIWLMVTLVLALPLMYLFMWTTGLVGNLLHLPFPDQALLMHYYLMGYFVSILVIYLARFVAMAIKRIVA